MDENNRNFILAIVLSIAVLFFWQFFFVKPPVKPEPAQQTAQQQAQPQQPQQPGPPQPSAPGQPPIAGSKPPQPGVMPPAALSRADAIAKSERTPIDTPSLKGSINLTGARIDDLVLKKYRETVEPNSPNVVLLSPAGARTPITPSMASSATPARISAHRDPIRSGRLKARGPSPRNRRSSSPTTTARGLSSPAPSRSMKTTCSR